VVESLHRKAYVCDIEETQLHEACERLR
jgi:hypothetical protein